MSQTTENRDSFGKDIAKYAVFGLLIAVVFVFLFTGSKVLLIYSIYYFFLNRAATLFGQDIIISRLFAVLATSTLIFALPWISAFIFLGKRKKEVLIGTAIVYTVFSFALFYGARDVFFDRDGGGAVKYYIRTLDGFKFSNAPDVDPQWGIRYEPVTNEVMRQYRMWQKTGQLENTPKIIPGKYFNMLTGQPIVWYVEGPEEGQITVFPLPGYDPRSGQALKPITGKVVISYENYLKQEAEKLGAAEKENQLKAELERIRSKEKNNNTITVVGELTHTAFPAESFELQPDQTTESWRSVHEDLEYGFISDGPEFRVVYQEGDPMHVREKYGAPISGRPGRFKVQAQVKSVKVTLLINKPKPKGAASNSTATDNDQAKTEKKLSILRWVDEQGIIHFKGGELP